MKRKSSTAISVIDCFSICHPNSYGGSDVFDKIVNELNNKEQAKALQPERVTTRSVLKRGTAPTRRMARQQRATTQGAVLASTNANQKSPAARVLQLKNGKKKRKQNNRSDHGNKRKK